MTIDYALVAPCGMNCAICSGYLAVKHDLKAKGIRLTHCIGCRPRNKKCAWIKKACAELSKGEISFCYECKSFPCHRLMTIDERYRSRYRMSMIENLRFIKAHGMEKFLEEQEKSWKCKRCDGMICCHNGLCFDCDLEKLRNKKQKYRWDEK